MAEGTVDVDEMLNARRCTALRAAVEVADDGVRVTDAHGRVIFESAALAALVVAEAERVLLDGAIADARNAALARGRLSSASDDVASRTLQLRTEASEYRVRATVLRTGKDDPLVATWVRQCKPRQVAPECLRERYGLTAQELRVLTLVAAGSRSREIGEVLGISPHTARRHTEALMKKLGVHSRSAVRERLRE